MDPANNEVLAPVSLTLLRHFIVDVVRNADWEPSQTMMIDCGIISPVFCFLVVILSA